MDEAAEDSEQLGTRHGPIYGPNYGDRPAPNGNYVRIVVAWASVITTILILTFAYLWTSRDAFELKQDQHAEHQDAEIMALWAARAQDRETMGRMEAHIEYLQKQQDRLEK